MFKQIISGGAAALSLSILTAVSVPQTAHAATCTFDDGGTNLQAVFDGITNWPVPGVSSTDVTTDCLDDLLDSKWAIGGTGSSIGTVLNDDGSTNFGIYDWADPTNKVEIFSGAAAGAAKVTSVMGDGSVLLNFVDSGIDFASNMFGYYIEIAVDVFLFSDSSLNPDGIDRMYAYAGNGDVIQIPPWAAGTFGDGEYMITWDSDQAGVDDGTLDFNDLVVLVESVHPQPVPEPMTLGLLGLGLVGIGFARRRRKAA